MEHHITRDTPSSRKDLYLSELQRANQELDEEKHKPLGLFDDLLNLLCWIETPEERVHKNRLASITLNEVGRHSREPSGWPVKAPGVVSRFGQRLVLALAKAK